MKKLVEVTIRVSKCGKYCGTHGRGCQGLDIDNNVCRMFLAPLRLLCDQSGGWQWKRCRACVKREINYGPFDITRERQQNGKSV
jgi:hypothetical protein